MSGETMLKVSVLKVAYGGIQAVKGVSLEVRSGELVSLIGANGAGKTTTLKAITGVQPPGGGDIEYMSESRRLVNRRLKRELRVALRYPTVREGLLHG